jgi:prepilin-type N-terminal cleavage/methylation domain-containing protein
MKINFKKQKGFTFIELLISLAVTALLLAIIIPSFSKFRNEQALKAGTEDILSTINDARTRTLASYNSSVYGVHFTSSSVTLFTGSSYSSGSSTNEVKDLSLAVAISTSLAGGTSDVVFDRLTGATSNYGTLTIQAVNDTSRTRTITISKTGVISAN